MQQQQELQQQPPSPPPPKVITAPEPVPESQPEILESKTEPHPEIKLTYQELKNRLTGDILKDEKFYNNYASHLNSHDRDKLFTEHIRLSHGGEKEEFDEEDETRMRIGMNNIEEMQWDKTIDADLAINKHENKQQSMGILEDIFYSGIEHLVPQIPNIWKIFKSKVSDDDNGFKKVTLYEIPEAEVIE